LIVELHAADAREIVLARIEEHAFEQLSGGVERGRIAGAQLAVDFDQRVVCGS
jgi:ABC-type transport system involved in cytochrome c biogenesis ATPase subunit